MCTSPLVQKPSASSPKFSANMVSSQPVANTQSSTSALVDDDMVDWRRLQDPTRAPMKSEAPPDVERREFLQAHCELEKKSMVWPSSPAIESQPLCLPRAKSFVAGTSSEVSAVAFGSTSTSPRGAPLKSRATLFTLAHICSVGYEVTRYPAILGRYEHDFGALVAQPLQIPEGRPFGPSPAEQRGVVALNLQVKLMYQFQHII